MPFKSQCACRISGCPRQEPPCSYQSDSDREEHRINQDPLPETFQAGPQKRAVSLWLPLRLLKFEDPQKGVVSFWIPHTIQNLLVR